MPQFQYTQVVPTIDELESMIDYILLGPGSPTRQTFVRNFTLTTSGANQAVTGVGFEPECVIIFGCVADLEVPREGARLHLGVGTTALDQWAMSIASTDNVAPQRRQRRFKSDKIITMNIDGSVTMEASLVSMDADGFTLAKSTAPSVNIPMAYVAMRGGGSYEAGVEDAPGGGGTQSISVSFDPDVMFFGTVARTADGSDGNAISWGMGACDDTRQHSNWAGVDAASVNTSSIQSPTSSIIIGRTQTGAASLQAKAERVSLGTTTQLNWTTSDGNAYRFGWLALQDAVVDRFEFVPDSGGSTSIETVDAPALFGEPVGLLGFNTSIDAGEDDVFKGGAAIAFSACDEIAGNSFSLTGELSCSIFDEDAPNFGVVQTGGHFREGTFSCYKRRSGGGAGSGAGISEHTANILDFISLLNIVPMNWRSADRSPSRKRIHAGTS